MDSHRLAFAPRSSWMFVATAFVAALPASAGVTVVAPSGGDYTTIDAAVAAAADGEILLVKSGSYGPFTITGKALHVVADAGASVVVQCPVTVTQLPAGKSATLAGLELHHSPFPQGGLTLSSCAGRVRVDRCRVVPIPGFALLAPTQTFQITGCADVALESCASTGAVHSYGGVPGLSCQNSTLALHDCALTGGRGRNGIPSGQTGFPNTPGFEGLAGLETLNSTLYLSGSTLTGGTGGDGLSGITCSGYDFPTQGGGGGPALYDRGGSTITLLDTQLVGGNGGVSGTGPATCLPPPTGPAGTPTSPIGLPTTTLAGVHRSLGDVLPTREGGSVQLEFHGVPGDRVFIALAAGRTQTFDPVLNGVLLVLPPFRRSFLGTVDGTGTLVTSLPLSDLGAGVEGIVRNVQGIFVDTSSVRWTSGANAAVLLDASF